MARPLDIAGRSVASALLLAAVVYAGDYAMLRWRIAYPKTGEAFGTVKMEQLYAIPQKNGKIEYQFDARQPELAVPCVHTMLPHMSQSPCWYLQRNSQKPIPM